MVFALVGGIWTAVSVASGLALGAIIRHADQQDIESRWTVI